MTDQRSFNRRLGRYYLWYAGGFVGFIIALAIAEQFGMSSRMIGYIFLFTTVALYACIGVMSRTADVGEYYVAGRRVPALFNGMATGSDWMSAASFIGLAGTLYVAGYQGLAFVMGWTGGYVLVAVLLAPYLRKFGQFTIPDFLGARYGGDAARLVGVVAVIAASFVYVVAQIYGVGLVASRFIGIEFEIGVFVGLASILMCSFLGGMRAITWTQVAQYVILIIAYLLPVVLMSYKVTGVPIPQAVYGAVLERLGDREKRLFDDAREIEVRAQYRKWAAVYDEKIKGLPGTLDAERRMQSLSLIELKAASAPARQIAAAEKAIARLPKSAAEANVKWSRARDELLIQSSRPIAHATAFADPEGGMSQAKRINFLTLTLCLMIGTASLPHILTRFYTTPSVREARYSVFWSLLFIFLLYFTAPAYAVFAKWSVYSDLVGSAIASLPSWVHSWGKAGLVRINDVNGDGLLQLAELSLNPDVIVLATPEIAGLPYVVSGLVAAGGLAAALSTADGLLLTIANALSHDIYYKMIDPHASTQRRLVISKSILLVVAVTAAYTASLRPDNILFMVSLAFSIAGSAFFPALVAGIFWKRANACGAVAGMVLGLGVCLYYAAITHPFFGGGSANQWFGIESISCGIFGVPAGLVTLILVSLITPASSAPAEELVELVRYPNLSHEASERSA